MSDEEEWPHDHRLSDADLRCHESGGSGVEPYMAREIIAPRFERDAAIARAERFERERDAARMRATTAEDSYTYCAARSNVSYSRAEKAEAWVEEVEIALCASKERLLEMQWHVISIFEHREFRECWFPANSYDGGGDCGNFDDCKSDCPLRRLADMVGIPGRPDGNAQLPMPGSR